MKPKRILFKTALGVIVVFLGIILCVSAIAFWMSDPLNLRAPTDQKVITVFSVHREAFERLQQMATEDAHRGWYFNSPYYEGSTLNEARHEDYRRTVSSIESGLKVYTDYDSSMRFIFASGGLLAIGPGWVKGIQYVPSSYESNGMIYGKSMIRGITYNSGFGVIVTNLDNAHTLPSDVYLRRIETNWFIFYQRTN